MPPTEQKAKALGSSSDPSELRPPRILVADDDRLARELLAGILRNAGHQVDTVEDGQEALERVAAGGIDLVLLDLMMPRLGGLEACRLLKGMTADGFLPVVLVTVRTDTASRVEGLRIGADDYVCKPFDEQELLARVAGMLRIKRLHDQVAMQRARFERLSVHDEATGLYNYRYLSTRLSEEFKRAERYHEPFACVVIDIDQLRLINDAAGRPQGDRAIAFVADGIKRCVRDVDVVARYGGEEFLVVLPSTHFAGSVVVAERIWREVSGRSFDTEPEPRARDSIVDASRQSSARFDTPRELNIDVLRAERDAARASQVNVRPMTVSIGVALYPSRDVRTKDALLRAADAALSQAKREGGNRICVFQQQGYIYTPSTVTAPPSTRRPSNTGLPAVQDGGGESGPRPRPVARRARAPEQARRMTRGPARGRVLVVDAEPATRRSIARLAMAAGFEVDTADDAAAALDLVRRRPIDVALVDLAHVASLEPMNRDAPDVAVVVVAAFGEADAAIAAIRAGAYDFVGKPFASEAVVGSALDRALDRRRLMLRTRELEQQLARHERFGEVVGTSARIKELHRTAVAVAPSFSPILVIGENGTGKQLFARTIHRHSDRAAGPFDVLDCGALPPDAVEAELFGTSDDAPGLLARADGGTLLLARVGELGTSAQARLVDAVTRGTGPRLVTAANVDLKERVASGLFREDLFYKLGVVVLHVPPLRRRTEDIALLAYHFLGRHAARAGRDVRRIGVEALRMLRAQPWPGNVRELDNAIEHGVVMARGSALVPADLPFGRDGADEAVVLAEGIVDLPYGEAKRRAVEAFDRAYAERALARASGNVSEAARNAGMDCSNFRRVLARGKAE